MVEFKILLICSALLIVGAQAADTKVQWEAPETKLSNVEQENAAFKTLGDWLMAPRVKEKLIVESKSE